MDGRNLLKTVSSFALLTMLSCSSTVKENTDQPNIMEVEKKNLGKLLALYPKPMTVVGTKVEGKVNWLVVGHTGVIGHDRILVSMSKQHYSNQGIKQSKKLSINLVSREMLPKADYVGSVSGKTVDKSSVFAYHIGENGTPVIDVSPLTMECMWWIFTKPRGLIISSAPWLIPMRLPMYLIITVNSTIPG